MQFIIELLQAVHAYFFKRNHLGRYKERKCYVRWIASNMIVAFCCHGIYLLMKLKGSLGILPKPLREGRNVVISLTTFPARIKNVWMVIDCLFRQMVPPSEIILVLSLKDFPLGTKELPKTLQRYQTIGLKIKFVNENLKPHKKYYYAVQREDGKCVVTVDDDLFYRKDMLLKLWQLHSENPDCVCANNGRIIQLTSQGTFASYSFWQVANEKAKGNDLVAIGFGGVLYPAKFYRGNKNLTDIEKIKTYCLNADDLWLKANELVKNTQVVKGEYYPDPATIPHTTVSSLQRHNRIGPSNNNDKQWSRLDGVFNLQQYFQP